MSIQTEPVARLGKAQILIVDDHPCARLGISHYISQEPNLAVCGQVGSGAKALRAINLLGPDLVLVDLMLPGRDGLELIKQVKAIHLDCRMLVFSMYDESLYAERALRAGACGYVMKDEPSDRLMNAIHRALAGETVLGRRAVERVLRRLSDGQSSLQATPIELLSDRELEIFRLIGDGHPRGQIAVDLNISVKTVESHRTHIRRKMGFKNAAELYRYATQFVQEDSASAPVTLNRDEERN